MISASFVTANHTVNNRGKLPKSGIVIRKLSFAPRSRAALSLVTAVQFSNGQEVLFIDYSGAKCVRFAPKIAVVLKALFRVVKNSCQSFFLPLVEPGAYFHA